MLKIIADHADKTDAEGNRGCPPLVDDASQVGVGELLHVLDRPIVHGVVVPEQELTGHLDGCDILSRVPIAGSRLVEREVEPLHPAIGRPDLIGAGDVRDVIILDPGQVPYQPSDGVRVVDDPEGQLIGTEPVNCSVHDAADPVESVNEQVSTCHINIPGSEQRPPNRISPCYVQPTEGLGVPSGSVKLEQSQCQARLVAARVAYLATSGPDLRPHIVPITCAVYDDVIVAAIDQKPKSTTDVRRLHNIAENPMVAVLCDNYSED